jgi:tetratricopeptide (TPR) repeat protein
MQLLCAMGNYLQQQQRIDLAARSYQTAVQYGQINFGTWHLTNIVDIATTCLSVSLELQDKQEEAFALLENTLLERPHSDRIRYQLIDLHVRHGRRKEAIEQAARLSAEWPHREAFTNAVRGACLAGEENWSGAIAYLQTAFDAGCCDVLCLRWLSLTYAALEQFDAAQEVLEQWRAVEPDSREIPKITTRIQGKQSNPPPGQGPNATESVRGETFQIHPPDDSLSPTKRKTTTADIQPGENPETA